MLTEPEMFRAVIDQITVFYLEANRILYEAVLPDVKPENLEALFNEISNRV